MQVAPPEAPTERLDAAPRDGTRRVRKRRHRYVVAVAATCAVLGIVAYVTRDAPLGTPWLHIDDAWVLLGWKAHRFLDVRRAGSTSLGFVLLERGWLDVAGFTYRNARLLPLFAGTLVAPVFFVAALRMRLRAPAALLGAAMLLASPTLVSYATRVKQYQLEVILATVAIALGAATIGEPTSRRRWFLFSVVAVVALAVSFVLLGVVVAGLAVGNLAAVRAIGRAPARRYLRAPSTICTGTVALFSAAWYFAVIRPALSPALRDFWSAFYLSEPRGVPNRPPFWHPVDVGGGGLLAHDWRLVQSLFREAFTGPTITLVAAFVVAAAIVGWRRPMHALLFGIPVVVAIAASFAQVAPLGGGRVDVWLYAPIVFMFASGVDVALEWARTAHVRGFGTRGAAEPRRPQRTRRPAELVLTGAVVAVAIVWIVSIPRPATFTWPDIVPLVRQLEAGRSDGDLVVVSGPLMFNYALSAPQPFVTRVSERNATRFAPVVQGVNAMNWADYPDPMGEFRARLQTAGDVWLLDTPEIIYPLGSEPRTELANRGYTVVSGSRRGGGVLEHWRGPPG